jgi:glycosyltransferase involved in cell wall biosynthesis
MPTIPYNRMYQRPQQIMKKLSEVGYTVYYTDNINKKYLIKINDNLYEIGKKYNINYEKLSRPIILWCSSPEQITRINSMIYDYIVYDVVDDCSCEFETWSLYIEDMLNAADIVFTASDRLYRKFFSRHSYVYAIKNGLDIDNFSPGRNKIPEDIPRNRKIVGYAGAIATWIDWNLVRYISSNNTYNFVFVGAKCGKININLNGNVYFLGEKRYEELPYYINNFSCCIIPFKVNEMTNSCNPIKLYEYMSLGKPVVSTAIEEVVKVKDLCYISGGKYDFMENIIKSVDEDNEKLSLLREKFAFDNSWDERVCSVLKILRLNHIL